MNYTEDNFDWSGQTDLLTKNKDMKNKFDFIYSPVFWQLFLIGVAVGLNFPFPNNVWVQGLSAMITVWFGGSVGVNTFNKRGEKAVEVAQITADAKVGVTTVSIPANVSNVKATTAGGITGSNY